MELVKVIILFIGGLAGGFYAANIGGGAIVSFPLLILIGLPTHVVIATQRLAILILELTSAARFYKARELHLKLGLVFGLFAAAGSAIGSSWVIKVNERLLNLIIGILLLLVFVILQRRDKLGLHTKKVTHKHTVIALLATFLLGIYGGFFGAGFGAFIIFVLIFLGFTFIKSAGIGRVIGSCMSLASAAVFIHQGLVNYLFGISLGVGFAIGGWIGIGVALKKGDNYIRTLYAILLVLSLLKLASSFLDVSLF